MNQNTPIPPPFDAAETIQLMRNSVVEACIHLPNVAEYIATLERRAEVAEALKNGGEAQRSVCEEVLRIIATYHEQEARGDIDTPGGLEHMGDVWSLFMKWEKILTP